LTVCANVYVSLQTFIVKGTCVTVEKSYAFHLAHSRCGYE
jgi:hypothetical protein